MAKVREQINATRKHWQIGGRDQATTQHQKKSTPEDQNDPRAG